MLIRFSLILLISEGVSTGTISDNKSEYINQLWWLTIVNNTWLLIDQKLIMC